MEQITQSFHLEQQDSKPIKKQTTEQRKLLQSVSALLKRTMAASPNQEYAEGTQDVWTEEWFAIASNQTSKALQAAVERHRQRGDGFVPQATTRNKLIGELAQEKRNVAAQVKVKFKACEKETGYGTPSWQKCAGGLVLSKQLR